MALKRRIIKTDEERNILAGMVVSTAFLSKVKNVYRRELLKIEPAQMIGDWIWEYFSAYGKAPGKNIKDIFKSKREGISEETENYIDRLLERISNEYEPENFNVDFLLTETTKYFRERSVENLAIDLNALTKVGRFDKALSIVNNFIEPIYSTTEIFNPFDSKIIAQHMVRDEKDVLFSMPGALGGILGPLRRGWLVSLMAPEKRGKSWTLIEMVVQALMARLRVLCINLEMGMEELNHRIYCRVTRSLLLGDKTITLPIPTFDCAKAQSGACKTKYNPNKGKRLLDSHRNRPEWDPKIKYTPCDYCRYSENKQFQKRFIPEPWFYEERCYPFTHKRMHRKAKQFKLQYGNNLRLYCPPPFSITITEARYAIEEAIAIHNFRPDVIVFDYLDILAPERYNVDTRQSLNEIWQRAKGIAREFNALVITADQAVKAARSRDELSTTDTTEDKRKDAHVDAKMGMTQTPAEKEVGRARYNVLFHRHRYYNERRQVMALQSIPIAQPILDTAVLPIDYVVEI